MNCLVTRPTESVAPTSIGWVAHGQTIKIHNDYLGAEESHRLLIQLNEGWEASQGGLLMLFGAAEPESLQGVLLPVHGSGFAFEISPKSFHAVSSIVGGERYRGSRSAGNGSPVRCKAAQAGSSCYRAAKAADG